MHTSLDFARDDRSARDGISACFRIDTLYSDRKDNEKSDYFKVFFNGSITNRVGKIKTFDRITGNWISSHLNSIISKSRIIANSTFLFLNSFAPNSFANSFCDTL